MDASIVVSIITGLFTFGGVVITVLVGNSKTAYRITKLEENVDKLTNLSEKLAVTNEAVKALHKRVDRLEGKEDRK